jgi:hypothetical protein
MDECHEVIISRAQHLRQEIAMIFNDVEHWNRIHPDEKPIDADPDGLLRRMAHFLEVVLEQEGR